MRTKRARKTVQGVRTDARIWPLLERYCKLAKVKLIPRGADLYEMKLPLSERPHFSGRATVRVALSLEALERALRIDYAELRDPYDLERPTVAAPTTRLFLAAFVGKTRLIDNGAIGDPHRIE